jgi:hypothetical protein
MSRMLAIGLSSFALAGAAAAADTVYFGFDRNTTGQIPFVPATNSDNARAGFVAALPGQSFGEDFEAYAPNTLPGTWGFGGGLSMGFTSLTPNSARMYNAPINGLHATSGSKFLDSFAATPGKDLWKLTSPTALFAIGFNTSDMDDWLNSSGITPKAWELVLDGPGGQRVFNLMPGVPLSAVPSGSRTFWGVVTDEAFTSATLRKPGFSPSGGEGFAIDDVIVAVPSPASGLGLIAGAMMMGRRRK